MQPEQTPGSRPSSVVPLLQTIRGMCSDEDPYPAIDSKLAEAIYIAERLREERDRLLGIVEHISADDSMSPGTAQSLAEWTLGWYRPGEEIVTRVSRQTRVAHDEREDAYQLGRESGIMDEREAAIKAGVYREGRYLAPDAALRQQLLYAIDALEGRPWTGWNTDVAKDVLDAR